MLELKGLVLKPGAAPIDHRFEAGQITVVLGRNQSGKTLLARVIAGLAEPVAGTLHHNGDDLSGVAPGQRPVSLVYQAFVNYPHWSVYDNLASPLRARTSGGRFWRGRPGGGRADGGGTREGRSTERESLDDQVRNIAVKLGLEDLLHRFPHELSGGQQQRVAIGRALAKSADVLVMDEPLVNLDYKLREGLQLELNRLLRDAGTTVIYTSSDPRDAFAVGDRVLLMADHGKIQSGEPLEVFQHPVSLEAADLMSDPGVNRFAGTGGQCGVRPEHLHATRQAEDDVAFDVRVLGSETNGSETFLHCSGPSSEGEADWVARLHGLVNLPDGERHTLYAHADAVLRFGER